MKTLARLRTRFVTWVLGLGLAALPACSSVSKAGLGGGGAAGDAGTGDGAGGVETGSPSSTSTGPGSGGGNTTTTTSGAGGYACADEYASDPANCGTSGHDCLGGACVACSCQPVRVATLPRLAYAMTLDTDRVYVAYGLGAGPAATSIASWSRPDWTSTTLATWPDGGQQADRILAKNGYVYFFVEGESVIKRVPVDGLTPPESFVATSGFRGPLAVDDTDVYHLVYTGVDPSDQTVEVRKTSLMTGASVALAEATGFSIQLAVDDTNAYVVVPLPGFDEVGIQPEIFAVPKAGGPKVTLVDQPAGVFSGALMGLAGDQLILWRSDGGHNGISFASFPTGGGAMTDLGFGDDYVSGALNQSDLAWIAYDSSFESGRCLKAFTIDAGGTSTVAGIPNNAGGPDFYIDAFAMDEKAFFWASSGAPDAELWMLAR